MLETINDKKFYLQDWIRFDDVMIELKLSERQLTFLLEKLQLKTFMKVSADMETLPFSWANILFWSFVEHTDRSRWADWNLCRENKIYQEFLSILQSNFGTAKLVLQTNRFNAVFVELLQEKVKFNLPKITTEMENWRPPKNVFDRLNLEKNNFSLKMITDFTSELPHAKGRKIDIPFDHLKEIRLQQYIKIPIFKTIYYESDGHIKQGMLHERKHFLFDENLFLVRKRSEDGFNILCNFEKIPIERHSVYLFVDDLVKLKKEQETKNISNPIAPSSLEFTGEELFLSPILQTLVKLANSQGSVISGIASYYPNLDEVKKYLKNELNLSGKQEKVALQIIKRRKSTNFDSNKASIGFSEELRVACSLAKESWEPLMNIAVQIKNSYKGPRKEFSLVDFFKEQYPNGFFIGSSGESKKITVPSSKQLEQSLIERNVNQEFAKTLAGMMQIS